MWRKITLATRSISKRRSITRPVTTLPCARPTSVTQIFSLPVGDRHIFLGCGGCRPCCRRRYGPSISVGGSRERGLLLTMGLDASPWVEPESHAMCISFDLRDDRVFRFTGAGRAFERTIGSVVCPRYYPEFLCCGCRRRSLRRDSSGLYCRSRLYSSALRYSWLPWPSVPSGFINYNRLRGSCSVPEGLFAEPSEPFLWD